MRMAILCLGSVLLALLVIDRSNLIRQCLHEVINTYALWKQGIGCPTIVIRTGPLCPLFFRLMGAGRSGIAELKAVAPSSIVSYMEERRCITLPTNPFIYLTLTYL